MANENGELMKGRENTSESKSSFRFAQKPSDLVRESTAAVLARTKLPDRVVTLEDVSIYSLPVDWVSLKRLGLEINGLKKTPIEGYEIQSLKPSVKNYEAIPMVASVIANHYDPEIPVILPSEADVKNMRPWLRGISGFLKQFSPNLQYRFGRYIEKKADGAINKVAKNVLRKVDILGEIDSPKARFVPELKEIYETASEIKHETADGWFKSDNQVVPVENNVKELVKEMRLVSQGGKGSWLNKEKFPLIARALQIGHFPFESRDDTKIGKFGSEVLSGMQIYLSGEGVSAVAPRRPVEVFDVLNYRTWGGDNIRRYLCETFKEDQIEAVILELPNILAEVKNVLPESGPAVVNSVKTLAENILILSKQGVSNAEIATAIFSRSQSR